MTSKTPLNLEMHCGILTNPDGECIIVHNKSTKSPIQWIEFETSTKKLYLIHEDGQTQDLGLNISSQAEGNLLQGTKVNLIHIQDKKILSSDTTSLIIKDY